MLIARKEEGPAESQLDAYRSGRFIRLCGLQWGTLITWKMAELLVCSLLLNESLSARRSSNFLPEDPVHVHGMYVGRSSLRTSSWAG